MLIYTFHHNDGQSTLNQGINHLCYNVPVRAVSPKWFQSEAYFWYMFHPNFQIFYTMLRFSCSGCGYGGDVSLIIYILSFELMKLVGDIISHAYLPAGENSPILGASLSDIDIDPATRFSHCLRHPSLLKRHALRSVFLGCFPRGRC